MPVQIGQKSLAEKNENRMVQFKIAVSPKNEEAVLSVLNEEFKVQAAHVSDHVVKNMADYIEVESTNHKHGRIKQAIEKQFPSVIVGDAHPILVHNV
ncbi:MAG: hypothetical protein KDJ35_08940 [Alphaproteobacteria bacterium]|nr:hypothetical protein [Alphaproteobacteria bacterium]